MTTPDTSQTRCEEIIYCLLARASNTTRVESISDILCLGFSSSNVVKSARLNIHSFRHNRIPFYRVPFAHSQSISATIAPAVIEMAQDAKWRVRLSGTAGLSDEAISIIRKAPDTVHTIV